MKKALLTGGTGLLGSEIKRVLQEQGTPFDAPSRSIDGFDLIKNPADPHVRLANSYKGPDIGTVIHCAAKVGGVKANTAQVADFFDDNIKMNMKVLDACLLYGVKLVSVLSTCVYPDASYVTYPLTEDQLHNGPPHPSNFGYAYAKRMLEVQSRAYRKQFGSNFINVIPNNLYGPNDNYHLEDGHVIPALIRKFHEATLLNEPEVVVWGSGRALREFTFARDAARIIVWLAQNYDDEKPVNIGNTQEISVKDLAELIAEKRGYRGKIVFDTSKPEGQLRKPSSNDYLRSLGWTEEYTPLEQGIEETVEYVIENYPRLRGMS